MPNPQEENSREGLGGYKEYPSQDLSWKYKSQRCCPNTTDFLLIICEEPNLLSVMKISLKQPCLGLVWEGSFSPFSGEEANQSENLQEHLLR